MVIAPCCPVPALAATGAPTATAMAMAMAMTVRIRIRRIEHSPSVNCGKGRPRPVVQRGNLPWARPDEPCGRARTNDRLGAKGGCLIALSDAQLPAGRRASQDAGIVTRRSDAPPGESRGALLVQQRKVAERLAGLLLALVFRRPAELRPARPRSARRRRPDRAAGRLNHARSRAAR